MKYRYREPEELKNSGVEWLGKIPKEWKIKKLKFILDERKEKNNPIKTKDILSLMIDRGVIPYSEKGGAGNKAKDDLTQYKIARENDIVINSMNIIVGAVGLSKYFGAVSPVYYTLYSNSKNVSTYFYYKVFQSEGFQKSLLGLGNGILIKKSETSGKLNTIRMRIPMEKLGNVFLPSIFIDEQQKIADFLDKKTKEFDLVMGKKEKLIKKLEEAKKSLISEVVTGKKQVISNKSCVLGDGRQEREVARYAMRNRVAHEMKDSGIEWLGMIPKEWEVTKLKYYFDFYRGLPITKADLKDEGIACLNYGEIHSKYPFIVNSEKNNLKKVSEIYLKTNQNSLLRYGDLVFADTSEDLKGSGNFTFIDGEANIFAGYHTIVIRPKESKSKKYLAYLFESMNIRKQIQLKVKGVKVYSITQNILKEVFILKSQEEIEIADFLDEKTTKFDSIIQKNKDQIEKIKEAKQSLISEAVTGKIEIM